MTALSTLTDALKRELAVPGTFDDTFPDTADTDLIGALADGFAEAQLNGFFKDTALAQADGAWETTPDISLAGGALIVIFASMRTIRAQIRNLNSVERYKAGPAEFEIQHAATTLKAELDYLKARLEAIVKNAGKEAAVSAGMASVFDNYLARDAMMMWESRLRGHGGFYAWERC